MRVNIVNKNFKWLTLTVRVMYLFSAMLTARTTLTGIKNKYYLKSDRRLFNFFSFQVKILDVNQIAVVTVQSAFLDDESSVLNDLSDTVGYQIKVLRGVVISQNNENLSRTRRNSENIADISLQLYIYGIHENEPVHVVRLTRYYYIFFE